MSQHSLTIKRAGSTKKRTMKAVPTLQSLAAKTIRRRVGLYNFWQMDKLPLPRSICASLQDLCLMDFYINPFLLEWHHKRDNVFPATCNVDGSIVHLKFHEKEEAVRPNPALITTFLCNEITIGVYQQSLSLERLMLFLAKHDLCVDEYTILKLMKRLIILGEGMPDYCVLYPQRVHFNQHVVEYKTSAFDDARFMTDEQRCLYYSEDYDLSCHGRSTMMLVRDFDPHTQTCYEAPELSDRSKVADERCNIWTLGCLVQKVMSLRSTQEKPQEDDDVNSNEDDSGFIHEITKNIDELTVKWGTHDRPPFRENTIPEWMNPKSKYHVGKYSKDLCQLVKQCIQADPTSRPSLEEIKRKCRKMLAAYQKSEGEQKPPSKKEKESYFYYQKP